MATPAPDFVQPQAFDASGKPIAPEEYSAAASEGRAYFKKGERVYARDSAGQLVTLDASEVAHPGYQILTPDQVQQAQTQKQYGEGLGNVVKAGAAGAARGLTLGASDAIAGAIGGEDTRRALKGLREANPIASTTGELAGAAAPLLLSGGTSSAVEGAGLVAKAGEAGSAAVRTLGAGHRAIAGVGSLVERGAARGLAALGADGATAAGRIGAAAVKLAARGAAEGALYGAAGAANDAVLNGDDITAEKIVAGMGHGALFGGLLGGTLGGVARATGELGAKLVPTKEGLKQMAREQGLKAAGFKGSDFRKLVGRATGDAADQRIAATADDLMNTTLETGALKGERVLKPGANAEETLARISAAKQEAAARLSGLKDEISEGMAAAGTGPNPAEFLRRADEQVLKPALRSSLPGVRAEVRAAQRELSIMRANVDAAAQAGNAEQMAYSFKQLDEFRQELAGRVYPKAPAGGGLPPPPPKGAEQLQKVERLLSDYLKEEAGAFLVKVGDNPNAYNEANRQFHSFRQLEQVGTKTVNQGLGNRSISPSDHALGIASGLGALATGNVGALGSMAMGGAAAFANKMLRERGNSLVADLARRAAETDSVIQTAANALAGQAEKVKAPALATVFTGKNLADQYQRTAERVRELAQPALAQQHVSDSIQEVAAQYPNVGAAVSRKLLTIYQQLSAQLPQSHTDTGTTLTPLAVKARVPPVEQQRFMSTVRGALEPESVIADLGRGILDRPAIESFKATHPQMFQQLRTRVAEVVEQRKDEVPFKRRIMLSMVFDFEGDSSLNPQRGAELQKAAQSLSVADAAKDQQMVKPKNVEPGKSKTAESFALPSQSAISGAM